MVHTLCSCYLDVLLNFRQDIHLALRKQFNLQQCQQDVCKSFIYIYNIIHSYCICFNTSHGFHVYITWVICTYDDAWGCTAWPWLSAGNYLRHGTITCVITNMLHFQSFTFRYSDHGSMGFNLSCVELSRKLLLSTYIIVITT